jgi:hypothetical protein
MMKTPAVLLGVFLLGGCSSSSTPTTDDDASSPDDSSAHDTGSTSHHEAGPDSGPAARGVCLPRVDAGSDASARDAATDAKPKDAAPAKEGGEAGTVHCTSDPDCSSGDLCDIKTSKCVANTGKTYCMDLPDGGGTPGTCSVNSDDMCCTEAAGCLARPPEPMVGGGACCPGAAGDKYCQSKLSDDTATCGAGNSCTTCMDSCINANPGAYANFLQHQVEDCGCVADGACYAACHDSTTTASSSACGMCLASQTGEGLSSTCTLQAAADCISDPDCSAYQACAGMCPM